MMPLMLPPLRNTGCPRSACTIPKSSNRIRECLTTLGEIIGTYHRSHENIENIRAWKIPASANLDWRASSRDLSICKNSHVHSCSVRRIAERAETGGG